MIVRELVARFGFVTDTSGLDRADQKLKSTKTNAMALAKGIAAAGAGLAAFGVKQEMGKAVDESLKFGEAMGKIQSLMPGNVARAREFGQAIKDMAQQTGKSLDDVAAGAYDVLSTFGDSAEAIEQVNIAVRTGAAGAGTTKDALALLSAVTKAYGDTSAASQKHISDLGFETINLGKIELPELAASIQNATPLAASLNVKLEELFGTIASASGVTGTGAEVTTQMNSAMQALLKKTPEMKKAFKKAGIKDVKDEIGKKGLVGVFRELVATTDGSIEHIDKLFGRIEGLKLILHLTQKGAGDFADKMSAMKNVTGATDAAFNAMTSGMAKQAQQAKINETRFANLRVRVGDELTPAFNDFNTALVTVAETMTGTVENAFGEWNTDLAKSVDNTNAMHDSLTSLLTPLAGLIAGLDEAALGFRVLARYSHEMKGGPKGETWEEMKNRFHNVGVENAEDAAQVHQRARKVLTAVMDPEEARQQVELAKARRDSQEEMSEIRNRRAAAVKGFFGSAKDAALGGGLVATVTGTTINVTLPQGTPAQHALKVAEDGAAQLWQKVLQQANRAAVNRTDKSGAEGWGAAGTNSTFD